MTTSYFSGPKKIYRIINQASSLHPGPWQAAAILSFKWKNAKYNVSPKWDILMDYSALNGDSSIKIGCNFVDHVKINKFAKFHNIWTTKKDVMGKIRFLTKNGRKTVKNAL